MAPSAVDLPSAAQGLQADRRLHPDRSCLELVSGTEPGAGHGRVWQVRHGQRCRDALSPSEALVAVTGNGADFMGLDDPGRIAAGKLADLLLVQGIPTKDIGMAADNVNQRAFHETGAPVALKGHARPPSSDGTVALLFT